MLSTFGLENITWPTYPHPIHTSFRKLCPSIVIKYWYQSSLCLIALLAIGEEESHMCSNALVYLLSSIPPHFHHADDDVCLKILFSFLIGKKQNATRTHTHIYTRIHSMHTTQRHNTQQKHVDISHLYDFSEDDYICTCPRIIPLSWPIGRVLTWSQESEEAIQASYRRVCRTRWARQGKRDRVAK